MYSYIGIQWVYNLFKFVFRHARTVFTATDLYFICIAYCVNLLEVIFNTRSL